MVTSDSLIPSAQSSSAMRNGFTVLPLTSDQNVSVGEVGHRTVPWDAGVSGDNLVAVGVTAPSAVPVRGNGQGAMQVFDLDSGFSRALDIAIAALALLVLAPVLLLIALAVWANDGGKPIFVHRRIGLRGALFPCLKFRSMVPDSQERLRHILATDSQAAAEWARDQKLRDDPRVTTLGSFLRKTSLDELPQLVNVLAGHMSLVGPRPIVANEVSRYGRYFVDYCQVKPGITGLWQVSGRNDVSYRRRVALDTVYSRSRSVGFDLMILGRTVPAVLTGRGSA